METETLEDLKESRIRAALYCQEGAFKVGLQIKVLKHQGDPLMRLEKLQERHDILVLEAKRFGLFVHYTERQKRDYLSLDDLRFSYRDVMKKKGYPPAVIQKRIEYFES